MIKCFIVTARKPHVCDYCDCEIRKGERHEVQTNMRDGRVYRWRAHLHCQALCSKIWDYVDPDEGMNGYGSATQTASPRNRARRHPLLSHIQRRTLSPLKIAASKVLLCS